MLFLTFLQGYSVCNTVTLYIIMDSSFWLDTINLRYFILHIYGCQIIIFKKGSIPMYLYGVDPDEIQHYAAFHLSLHCLQKYLFRGFKGLYYIVVVCTQTKVHPPW